jgi:hypothetical protein
VKRSVRDEPIWVVRHIYMETAQGISLYSYLYLKLAKVPCFLNYLPCFFLYKIGEHEGRTGSVGMGGEKGEVAQMMYRHGSK